MVRRYHFILMLCPALPQNPNLFCHSTKLPFAHSFQTRPRHLKPEMITVKKQQSLLLNSFAFVCIICEKVSPNATRCSCLSRWFYFNPLLQEGSSMIVANHKVLSSLCMDFFQFKPLIRDV